MLEFSSLPTVHKAEGGPEEESLRENYSHVEFILSLGLPTALEEEDLSSNLATARDMMSEETVRSRPPASIVREPASSSSGNMDLEAMKRKFPFLLEYSD